VEVLGHHHLHTRPEPPSERRGEPLGADLEAVVVRCLEKKPVDRFESATALAAALRGCTQGQSEIGTVESTTCIPASAKRSSAASA